MQFGNWIQRKWQLPVLTICFGIIAGEGMLLHDKEHAAIGAIGVVAEVALGVADINMEKNEDKRGQSGRILRSPN